MELTHLSEFRESICHVFFGFLQNYGSRTCFVLGTPWGTRHCKYEYVCFFYNYLTNQNGRILSVWSAGTLDL